jgi:glycosyltransferase involved in cell wall biosynthesis
MPSVQAQGSDVVVVVTTYNRPMALAWVLASLSKQTVMPGAILIADDGSGEETSQLIQNWKDHFGRHHPQTRLIHAWQEDLGFRAAAVRNLAVERAKAECNPKVLVFIDGDCLAPPHFIQNHLVLLEPSVMVAGGRGLLTQTYTEQLEQMAGQKAPSALVKTLELFSSPYRLWLSKACDRYLSMYQWAYPLFNRLRDAKPQNEGLVRTCNLSLWVHDFDRVDGFDESFVGWGLEDTEFAVRLIAQGVRVRIGRFATNVFHLWHPERSRSELEVNALKLDTSRTRFSEVRGS